MEESKSSRNELERKLKTMTEAQLQANNLAPELLARAETAEKNADIAIKKANAAEEAMKLAKEDAAAKIGPRCKLNIMLLFLLSRCV